MFYSSSSSSWPHYHIPNEVIRGNTTSSVGLDDGRMGESVVLSHPHELRRGAGGPSSDIPPGNSPPLLPLLPLIPSGAVARRLGKPSSEPSAAESRSLELGAKRGRLANEGSRVDRCTDTYDTSGLQSHSDSWRGLDDVAEWINCTAAGVALAPVQPLYRSAQTGTSTRIWGCGGFKLENCDKGRG